ncbi:hypothetical protein [Streptomyces sp. NPDC050504]|uniref:hypothetical protein n=1 Tax=Streptomyces sp. NPDC050504 TaxID=3365618 RepID=UPI0037AC4552
MTPMTRRHVAATAVVTGALATVLLGVAPQAEAAEPPVAPTPEAAASAPGTLDTLSRFFARDGGDAGSLGNSAPARSAAKPRIAGKTVAVRTLSPAFVAGKAGAPVATVQFHASTAVAADGRKASLWTVRQGGGWQVVNIATGDDETRYAALGAAKLPGGTVFREPQINAWYVAKGAEVLPLDEDAVRAVGKNGTTLAAYRTRVAEAYGDKLPGSGYAGSGKAGGYGQAPGAQAAKDAAAPKTAPRASDADTPVTVASATAGLGALAALALCGFTAARLRRRTADEA